MGRRFAYKQHKNCADQQTGHQKQQAIEEADLWVRAAQVSYRVWAEEPSQVAHRVDQSNAPCSGVISEKDGGECPEWAVETVDTDGGYHKEDHREPGRLHDQRAQQQSDRTYQDGKK